MTNAKSTKRALLLSVVSLFLCFTMLLGTTYAWFTDSASAKNNIIVAGNLDVDLEWSSNMTTWEKLDDTDNLFEGKLWEPGHTEVVYLKVTNLGTLALKYQLGVNVVSEVEGTNVANEKFKLSDYIEYDVVETSTAYADRAAALTAATDLVKISKEFSKDSKLETKDAFETVALIVTMPETVGNEANYKTGTTKPEITLGINVFATQLAAEIDSFDDQYDANAPFSSWDGTIPTEKPASLVVDTTAKTISINDAEAFAYFNTLINSGWNYGSKWQYTVELNADIDLANNPWTPITMSNFIAFNGNNHTIKNIVVNTPAADAVGLFAAITCNDSGNTDVRDLKLKNVNVIGNQGVGALAGKSPQGTIINVSVDNATVIGNKYVGGIFGSGNGTVQRSTVANSNILIPTGGLKEAGGLIGYLSNDGNATSEDKLVCDNVVKNVTVTAPTIASGLVSQPNSSNTGTGKIVIKNNMLENVTISTDDDTADYYVSNNVNDKSEVVNNTQINSTVKKDGTVVAYATDNASMGEAIDNGSTTVILSSGNYVIPSAAQGKTLTIVGNGDTSVAVTKVGTGGENCDYGLDGSTVVFENITITTNSSTYIGYARCKATFNNCTINGTFTLYDNCTFNDCTFNVTGDVYNIWTWGAPKAEFNNCTFNSDGKALLLYGTANTKLTVNNCTFNDNGGLADLKAAIEIGNDYGKSYELIVNNTVVNGYEINDKGINTGSTLWANKNSMGTDKLNVVIDGVDIY